ncbi:hypothetical protein CSKR_101952 [Clonorchis sinensis]|uniref:Uncharacterized protein n=1 Tax=Clonorchis sinensis TaxID=79923 RepID=A0A3R7DLC7_CLOSI|nr:hypothetical protein CSKR_101952 [Clonorchis sinensis]
MWSISGSPSRKTAVTSAAEFAGNGFYTSLPSHCLTASGSLPPFTWLCEKNPSRNVISSSIEGELFLPNTIRRTSALLIRCSHQIRAMLRRHRWSDTESLFTSTARSGQENLKKFLYLLRRIFTT